MTAVLFLGQQTGQGIYILRLHVAAPLTVSFGRFQGGRPLELAPGAYLYLGSALGQRGATNLAGRLLRHTARSGTLPPHAIRATLTTQLQEAGLLAHNKAKTPPHKHCFWHIDYLVDQLAAEITQIWALRTPYRLETKLARLLARDPAVLPVAPGLGASDDPHATHLLQVAADAAWWQRLPLLLTNLEQTQSEELHEYTTPPSC